MYKKILLSYILQKKEIHLLVDYTESHRLVSLGLGKCQICKMGKMEHGGCTSQTVNPKTLTIQYMVLFSNLTVQLPGRKTETQMVIAHILQLLKKTLPASAVSIVDSDTVSEKHYYIAYRP